MGLITQLLLLFSVGLTLVSLSKCDLEAILTNSRLPATLALTTSIYDKNDSIYIFGGYVVGTGDTNTVHRYEISTDTLFSSIAFFPQDRYGGGISSDSKGNIFYYGGASFPPLTPLSNVFKFNPTNSHLNEEAELNSTFHFASVITPSDDPNIAYLIGGRYPSKYQSIRCFNMSTSTGCGSTQLAGEGMSGVSTAFTHAGRAFVFCRNSSDFIVLNLDDLQSHVEISTLPSFYYPPSVVTDGNYGYLIGGWINSSSTPMDFLIKFNTQTFSHEFIHVKNHPGWGNGSVKFVYASTVYVEKLNRIYVIGGRSSIYHDEIWYIDLPTPTAPTTPITTTTTSADSTTWTTSTPTPDGNCTEDDIYFVPYPGDCSKYMICFHYDLLPDVKQCAPNTLFDPVLGQCNAEDLVPCEPICPNNHTVIYIPHRSNCSLFWLCVYGEIELNRCSENMVFDPQWNSCNYPEFVFCPNLCPTDIPIANFPHESDCSKYWHCLNGTPTLISCPDGQLYDPGLGQCSQDQEDCDKKL